MYKILFTADVLALMALVFSSCMSQSPPQQNQAGTVTPLEPATAVSAECRITPIYHGGTGQSGLDGVPWMKAEPSSSGIMAYLFFAGVKSSETQKYRPLHTGGKYPDGSATKILWIITNPHASNTIEIVGKKLSAVDETFHQTFPAASGPAGNYPSIINVPTPGCWQFDLKSGTVTATAVFWVIGDK